MHGAGPITLSTAISPPSVAQAQPRALGTAMISAKAGARGATLDDLRQSGALKMLFPKPDDGRLQAIAINTAGGVTGGDSFALTAQAGEHTQLSITTQAAERIYRAQASEVATIRNRLFVGHNARIEWLPQETILYNACACTRQMSVELDQDASLLLVEPLVFGRFAMGEVVSSAHFNDRIDIRRNGQPLFLDAMALNGDIASHLASPNIAAGAGALATLVYVAKDAEAHLKRLREHLPETGGASLIGQDLLIARVLAADSFELRKTLIPILRQLTDDALPRSWMT